MMKRIGWCLGIGMVGMLCLAVPALALLSQPIEPDEVWLTVYQGADRGWVVEHMSLFLSEGDNHFVFSGGDLSRNRFFLKPLSEAVNLRSLSTTDHGFRITLVAEHDDRYPVMLSFFDSGYDWQEWYTGILDGEEQILRLYPTVFLANTGVHQWQAVNLSWLLGSPTFEVEEVFDLFEEADYLAEPVAETMPALVEMKRAAPPVVEQVSEYQLFRLPYRVDFPARSRLAVFPGERVIGYTQLYRYQDGVTRRILQMNNTDDPLAGGRINLLTDRWEPLGSVVLPMVRSQEEFELSLSPSRLVSVERTVTRYRRLSVDWNDDREVTGFVSEREITFSLDNLDELPVSLELNEPLPRDGRIKSGSDWRWEDGKAIRLVSLDPQEEYIVTLVYEFREVL